MPRWSGGEFINDRHEFRVCTKAQQAYFYCVWCLAWTYGDDSNVITKAGEKD